MLSHWPALHRLQEANEMSHAHGPWEHYARRVCIHVADFLDFDGNYWPGGRQRHVMDLARVIRERWGREVVVLQKATRPFERLGPDNIPVVGFRVPLSSRGDSLLGYKTSRFLRPGDVMLYAGGEDGWPFFGENSKGIQHGIWWDFPLSLPKRSFQKLRTIRFARKLRSLLCVDTNFINWLREAAPDGHQLCLKCEYVPNYADTDALQPRGDGPPEGPIRLLIARRFEPKRGTHLFIEALGILDRERFPFHATICTVGGVDAVARLLERAGVAHKSSVFEDRMDTILGRYREADVAVVPTVWSEGTSLAAVEAISAGVPVVATPVGGLGNLVIPQFNGVIVQPTAAGIAEGIRQVASPDKWAKLHDNCLSMRSALSRAAWEERVCDWLRA